MAGGGDKERLVTMREWGMAGDDDGMAGDDEGMAGDNEGTDGDDEGTAGDDDGTAGDVLQATRQRPGRWQGGSWRRSGGCSCCW